MPPPDVDGAQLCSPSPEGGRARVEKPLSRARSLSLFSSSLFSFSLFSFSLFSHRQVVRAARLLALQEVAVGEEAL